MKVIIITDLYPKFQHDSVKNITWAVHELVKGLESNDIYVNKVIRPVREIHWKKMRKKKVHCTSKIDDLTVETKSFINLPRKGFYLTHKDLEYFKQNLKDVDLIITHMSLGAQLANVLFKKFNINYIYIMHENDFHTLNRQVGIFKNALAVFTRSWALSSKLEKFGVKSNGIIFSGVDESLIDFSSNHIGLQKELKFISVNRLEERKNIDFTLKILAKLPTKYTWKYTIIGEGSKKYELDKLILDLKISENVDMLGFQDRKVCIEKMKDADIFIMPSDPETFGLAYLEAMASNCIVICAKNSGVDGLIKNKISGYVVKARNEIELRNLIISLFDNDQTEILKASQGLIKQYTLSKARDNYANIIKKMKTGLIKNK